MALSKQARKNIEGYLYILPWLVGLCVFFAFPMLASMGLSFTRYEILTPIKWVGLQNYEALFKDPKFYKSLSNTVYYVLGVVPMRITLGLLLAVLLNSKLRGMHLYRTAFYIPSVTAGVAVALLWTWIFEPLYGVLNNLLAVFGIKGPPWLGSEAWAMPAMIIMGTWHTGRSMLVSLAGLQSVPPHLYEAVDLDGGGGWRKFWYVTIPLMTPIIFFNIVVETIATFQVFANAFIMTGGGPNNATLVYILYLYYTAFQFLHMGYASAMAWILFFIVFGLTLFQVWGSRRWVYYEGVKAR
jgi:multiple sugar transport system permease protein